MLTPLLLTLLFTAPYDNGKLLTYEGKFQPVKEQQPDRTKSFRLMLLIGSTDDGSTAVHWLLNDSDSQPVVWTERWGTTAWRRVERQVAGTAPSFPFEHGTGNTRVQVTLPLPNFANELKAGARWQEGPIDVTVEEGDLFQDRPTLEIVASTGIGRRRTFLVDRESQLVVSLRERVFVGQGEEHILSYQLVEQNSLTAEQLSKTAAAIESWSLARDTFQTAIEQRTPAITAAARKELSRQLLELKNKSTDAPLSNLSEVVAKQLKASEELGAAVNALRTKALGKPLVGFELQDHAGKTWSLEMLKDRPVILHFWSYRDENLREPYGQVGYLDFLARQHEGKALVLGVAVKPEDDTGHRSLVRKFRDFMNVSYPILLDDGKLLASLGDPRKAGGELPLFVVIAPDGKIIEYRAGHYEVQRDAGLAELSAQLKALLK